MITPSQWPVKFESDSASCQCWHLAIAPWCLYNKSIWLASSLQITVYCCRYNQCPRIYLYIRPLTERHINCPLFRTKFLSAPLLHWLLIWWPMILLLDKLKCIKRGCFLFWETLSPIANRQCIECLVRDSFSLPSSRPERRRELCPTVGWCINKVSSSSWAYH